MAPITRRALLLGGLGTVVTAAAGNYAFQRTATQVPRGVPNVAPGPLDGGTFVSAHRGGLTTGWSVAYPPGSSAGDRLPVLIVLHGRGGNHRSAFDGGLFLQRYLAEGIERGLRPFAIASVDGGDQSYWHPRRDGDTSAMLLDEFVPLLARRGLNTTRPSLLGWSMGGYGALYLATRLGAGHLGAVVAESPAVWHSAAESAAGAFDDAADFDQHAIFGHTDALTGVALRIDCGSSDGFAPVTRDVRAAISPTPAGGIESGGHDEGYWRSQARAQLAFVSEHLGT
ncbi:MAG TPA: alpha/beta hydrolase-fold protein [Jatrophihabitantaceae bacterium]|nr:alpha/beta hydrolase-fold protein [Jatrophihabitantaceae bacterium]